MIASIFLLFVAFGISIAAAVYGFGGVFPFLVGLAILAVIVRMLADRRHTSEA